MVASYQLLKFVHILSAVVLAGTGTGIAFFMFMAARSRNVQAIAEVSRLVVLADWLFTAPAVVIQFLTGLWLMNLLGYSYTSAWFMAVISLFVFIGACWLPVVWIQYRLRYQAVLSVQQGQLTATFRRLMRVWTALGIPAFIAILLVFWLMVFKPLAVMQ